MDRTRKKIMLSAIFLAFSIIMGAFAAHGAKDYLSDTYLKVMDTANKYLMYFSIIHFGMSLAQGMIPGKKVFLSLYLGVFLFSGSLYAMCFMDAFHRLDLKVYVVALTPLGGVAMIVSLLLWAFNLWRKKG